MKVNISKITNAINKISDMTSGEKVSPLIMLDVVDNKLNICYTDGHKALIEKVDVESEAGDYVGGFVVDFGQIARAIANCQPSGIIKVKDLKIKFIDGKNVLTISAEQFFEEKDGDGNVVNEKVLSTKKMDLAWTVPGADMKSAILTRVKYNDIFNTDVSDEYDRKELIDALSRTSTEKGKQVYISTRTQSVFVSNQSHVTSMPLSKVKELTEDELNILYAEVAEKGLEGEEKDKAIKDEIKTKESRVHFAVSMNQTMAKSVIGVLNKLSADKVYLYTRDKGCNIFVETEDETVGIWFEMPQASKAHTGALDKYNSMSYGAYQLVFMREFLDNNVKSALNATKSEKVKVKFVNASDGVSLIIGAASGSASVADEYSVVANGATDVLGDLYGKEFNISLKVLADMLAQLKTKLVAFDIEVGVDGTSFVRVAEIDEPKFYESYTEARKKTEELCKAQGIEFKPNETPTPVELQLEFRGNVLLTKQYTILPK